MKKKKDALQKARSLMKKAENVHTPSTIKRKLKVKDKDKEKINERKSFR